MAQHELFNAGPRTKLRPGATPAPIGSGPEGETCRGCRFKVKVGSNCGAYLKCKLMEALWTRGPASDIRAKWAACSEWKPIEGEQNASV